MSIVTPIGLLSFPNLYVPRPRSQGGDAVFSASLIFKLIEVEKDAKWLALKAEVLAAIADKWGEAKSKDKAFLRTLQLPWRDGSEKSYAGYGEGTIFINPWSKIKPAVIDRNKNDILVPADVFAGQTSRFFVSPFAWENSGKRGASLQLEHVQVVNQDMPRLDGRKSASEAFADDLGPDVGGSSDDEDTPF
ncbi:MAG: DUF2815 family protein [Devosia sp.]|nr:DUF2815 family protein [Devosia sp.]